ncbi:hypothetical protein BDN70DRAFT_983658, partial [Pholiota conissans]
MDSDRPSKRPRISDGTAYHDAVPFLQDFDYNVVHATEGILRRVGNDVRGARTQRDTQTAAGTWESTAHWSPPDDPEFALDPDGDMYDSVLCGEVMDEAPAIEVPHKRSKVSRRPHVVWMDLHRQVYLDEI